ncbi:MAG: sugar ABC transporter ATP-binding protein [Propionibacteriaceae bacterium]|jgi:ribose transport system ATP-binding protein|nr:sugar ABC transporter ATP-binding protein [Propionibacteriaceae bacterium]
MMAGLDRSMVGSHGLSVHSIVKRYGGAEVLGGVSISIQPGQILGLVGHNGAGKSTLLKTISGAVRPDDGSILIDGTKVEFSHPADALKAGIATVYQELSLLGNLTVTQNVFLGHELTNAGFLRLDQMREQAKQAMATLNLKVDVDRLVSSYPVAIRQLMEIAVAIHRDARYLLLDEPTTSLEGEQVGELLDVVAELARERNIGVLFISHKLDELYRISDRMVALVDGLVCIDSPTDSVPREDLIAAIAGSEASSILDGSHREEPARISRHHQAAPSVRAVHLRTHVLEDVSVVAYPGQVTGIYGLIGSGRTEFLRALMGLDPIVSGELELDGNPYHPSSPAKAAKVGLAYVTEDRKNSGIVPMLNSWYNVALPILHRFTKFGVLNVKRMLANADTILDQLRVRGNRGVGVHSLSGGNQQKVVLARALGQTPNVLLLDEPTKGVDIAVKVEIHRIIRQLAHETGMTVILVSSEDEEILDVADHVCVFVARRCSQVPICVSELTIADLRQAAWATH